MQPIFLTEYGLALFVSLNIAVFAGLIYWSARRLNRADAQREAAQAALRHSEERFRSLNATLEQRVAERTQQLDFQITQYKQAEEGLRRFELLSAHSQDIVLFMRRENGRILEANEAATRAYGYSRDELLALTIQDLRAGDTRSLTAEQMAQADASGILFETVHQRKDGGTFPVEVSS